jgi:dTDP-4-dehydrorhamnose reductase
VRVLVTGAQGMLASALLPLLRPQHEVWGVDIKEFDIGDEVAVYRAFRDFRPEFVYHLAALTDVDGCEANPRLAERVNADGTRNVARACAEIGAAVLYVSTDYVFDGRGSRPYTEDDCPNPISVYGLTKLRGEQYVQANAARHVIARSSWLYGPNGKNFVATILKLAKERGELSVVSDQRGSPTYTRHLANKLVELMASRGFGVFHVTGSGGCSWFEFAEAIVRSGGYPQVRVHPITTQASGRLARRPAYSILQNRRLELSHLTSLPGWTEGLTQYLAEGRGGGEFGPSPPKVSLDQGVAMS